MSEWIMFGWGVIFGAAIAGYPILWYLRPQEAGR